jgi:hypothetical protein
VVDFIPGTMKRIFLTVLAASPLLHAQYLTPNLGFDSGGTLNGTTFVNNGLVGAGRITGNPVDVFGESLGGGSAINITNWLYNGGGTYSGTFQMLPDRGYNAGTFFSNYAARVHEVNFTFTPYTGAGPVGQTQIVPTYNNVSTKFTYQDGSTVKFTSGLVPTGTSTVFGQTVGTVSAANGQGGATENLISFDAEAIHTLADGSGYMSDEYGTYIARFDSNKKITNIVQLPASAQPTNGGSPAFGTGATLGRNVNQGLEGLSVTPDGTKLMVVMQSALLQDQNTGNQSTRTNTRLYVYDISTPVLKESPTLTGEYAVTLPNLDRDGTGPALDRTAAQSEIVAISDTQFLMLPRDGNGLGNGDARPAVFKSVSLVDISGATNIVGLYDAAGNAIAPGGTLLGSITPAASTEVINMIATSELAKFGYNTNNAAKDINTFSEKWEGMALVPDTATADPYDYYLFVSNDNDFQGSPAVTMLDAAGNLVNPGDPRDGGITNDAQFLAYSVRIIPEPSSALLGLLGVLGLLVRRRR